MKKNQVIGILVAMIFIVALAVSGAEAWRGWKGSGGWGSKSQYQRMYNAETVVSIKGVVESIEQITPRKGMSQGIHLKVKTASETLSVHLGPSWFIERQDMTIEKGDSIEVTGSRISSNSAPAVIAAEVKKGETALKLRDEKGYPVWAGTGMGR